MASPLWSVNVFIYNPESKVRQSRAAKASLEKFLDAQGLDATVYIFASANDFNRSVGSYKPQYAIVASYFYTSMRGRYAWRAELQGVKGRSLSFNKILVTTKDIRATTDLRNKGIAAVFFGAKSMQYIDAQYLRPNGLSVGTVRIVSVSKDIDGIMALGFGQVQGAIVTQDSYLLMKRINPSAVNDLKQLKTVQTIRYPQFVSFPAAKERAKYKNAMRKLTLRSPGRMVLRYLNLTGFR